jgi:hypothetical protein
LLLLLLLRPLPFQKEGRGVLSAAAVVVVVVVSWLALPSCSHILCEAWLMACIQLPISSSELAPNLSLCFPTLTVKWLGLESDATLTCFQFFVLFAGVSVVI